MQKLHEVRILVAGAEATGALGVAEGVASAYFDASPEDVMVATLLGRELPDFFVDDRPSVDDGGQAEETWLDNYGVWFDRMLDKYRIRTTPSITDENRWSEVKLGTDGPVPDSKGRNGYFKARQAVVWVHGLPHIELDIRGAQGISNIMAFFSPSEAEEVARLLLEAVAVSRAGVPA